jgi:hydrogenase maturation protein HypF
MPAAAGRVQLHLECRGVVQGVGFRPLVHRLARDLDLRGEVENGPGAVRLRLEGDRRSLETFLRRLPQQLPPRARLERLDPVWSAAPAPATAPAGVRIVAGQAVPLAIDLVASSLVADRAPCRACLAELADPADRRFGYPFISCCDCGPRFSIATAEPWARAHTTLAPFALCPACRREFEDPSDRRFHAETIACPACGPRLALLDASGEPLAGSAAAAGATPRALIRACCDLLAAGKVLALQGVGGFQLLVAATDPSAVARLRRRKRRPAKPFALLVAEADELAPFCVIDAAERRALADPAAPIVLLRRRPGAADALPGVAPGSPCLGAMLPASPLHHLLARAFGRPLVATSGNPSGEPLCIDPAEAVRRLGAGAGAGEPIADAFLVQDRAIARPLDDSVLQVIDGRPALLRRARGYAPEPLALAQEPVAAASGEPGGVPAGLVALGGDLKSAPALALQGRVWLSPHLGDLAEGRLLSRLADGLEAIDRRWGDGVGAIACDAHPGYLSHQLAGTQRWPRRLVQHHRAHGLAVLAEHGLPLPLLAFTWDGLGFAPAASGAGGGARLWGGELLLLGGPGGLPCERRVALRPFPLPGGERAMAEPRRAALGLLAAAGPGALGHPGARHTLAAFAAEERRLLLQAIAGGCNSPLTTSIGRLFDAVASLLGLVQVQSHEGEGGLRLQGAASTAPAGRAPDGPGPGPGDWTLPLVPPGAVAAAGAEGPTLGWLDWEPLLLALLAAIGDGMPAGVCAARFHHALVAALAGTASIAAAALAEAAPLSAAAVSVALAGGCFQNRLLLEGAIGALRARGLRPYWPELVPCNDGGLALGQLWAVREPWADPGAGPTTGRRDHAP